jgi:exodeoxyribonuclease V alpha subunit
MPAETVASSLPEYEEFSALDLHFARLMERLSGAPNPDLALAAALVSRSQGQGSICLDLRTMAGKRFPNDRHSAGPQLQIPEAEQWMTALRKTRVVGRPSEFKPLILDGKGRLYLHRFWQYEHDLAGAIRLRAGQEVEGINEPALREGLHRLFPASGDANEADWQRSAAVTALRRKLCVISGGPGTGKTRTVVALLVLLLEQSAGKALRIALAAPTGKAAARLQEAITKWKATLPCTELIKARLPEESFTLHRLLGGQPDSARFRYNAENFLPFDVVVVDEASMVDLAMMARLFEAISPDARVVLLGDKDQLASVEAGAVLGDICAGEAGHSNPRLTACVVQLRKNYRFGADDGILALSRAINDGDERAVLGLMRARSSPAQEKHGEGVAAAELPPPSLLKGRLRQRAVDGFVEVLRAADPLAALKALGRFRILCALRQGPYGVENMNHHVEEILTDARLIAPRERWYAGRPVMVTRNDYQLKLFNGDVGVILPDVATGERRAWFVGADDTLRGLPPLRLPEHETVFATTVHKSQGSEFEEVLLILPDRDHPVLTRELLYTGATRASRRVEVWFNEAELRSALARRVERTSGLRDSLWGQSMVTCTRKQPCREESGDTID